MNTKFLQIAFQNWLVFPASPSITDPHRLCVQVLPHTQRAATALWTPQVFPSSAVPGIPSFQPSPDKWGTSIDNPVPRSNIMKGKAFPSPFYPSVHSPSLMQPFLEAFIIFYYKLCLTYLCLPLNSIRNMTLLGTVWHICTYIMLHTQLEIIKCLFQTKLNRSCLQIRCINFFSIFYK